MLRPSSLLIALVVIAAACSYESSGTTTTSVTLAEDTPVATGPADIVASDQRSEGSSVIIESLSLPSPGWVVARADNGGSPGEVVGISELMSKGVIAAVPVPFLVPIAATTTVHLAVHVDVDSDGEFRYEPPDAFIDEIATEANGEPATTTVTITLLPPLSPGEALLDEQVTDGTSLTVVGALLPAPGFVTVQQNEGGAPGAVLSVSDLFPAGEVGELVFELDPPLPITGLVFAVAWVDRDENGLFTPGPDGDEMAVRDDGSIAATGAVITVLRREPASLTVVDQEVEGDSFVVASIEMPAPGFIEILANSGGVPGTRLAVVPADQGTADDLVVALPDGVPSGGRLWLRLWIDFDQNGELSPADPRALSGAGGTEIQVSFVVTIP